MGNFAAFNMFFFNNERTLFIVALSDSESSSDSLPKGESKVLSEFEFVTAVKEPHSIPKTFNKTVRVQDWLEIKRGEGDSRWTG